MASDAQALSFDVKQNAVWNAERDANVRKMRIHRKDANVGM